MADHQKIHPVRVGDAEAQPRLPSVVVRVRDVEAQPRLPSVPPPPRHGFSNSGKGDQPLLPPLQAQQRPPTSVAPMISQQGRATDYSRINVPLVRSSTNSITPPNKRSSSSSCWCKCICWTICLVVLLLIIVVATGVSLYLVFHPKLPQYSVDSLSISDLTLNFDLSLYAKFNVKITATNPNQKIGIHYERGSQLSVWYTTTKLCQGTLPKFYQGHRNTTRLDVVLTGQNQYGSALMSALQQEQLTGKIPLNLKVNVPVSIELGSFRLRKVRILGTCQLIVDSLSSNNLITIKASSCKFGLKL